jgi:serine/threonine protein kinase
MDTLSGEYRMAKKLYLNCSSVEDETFVLNEVTMLKELSHPHIIKYHDIHLEGDCLSSLLEFCEGKGSWIQKEIWLTICRRRERNDKF